MEGNLILTTVSLPQLQTLIESAVTNALKSNDVATSQLIQSSDVMELCKISITTLQKWRDQKKIPFTKIDNKILYNKADVLNALYSNK